MADNTQETLFRITLITERGKGKIRIGSRHRANRTVIANPGNIEKVEQLTATVEDVTDEWLSSFK